MHRQHHGTCDICGGNHANVPTVHRHAKDGEVGGYCPHCGEWAGTGEVYPDEVETHPSVPDHEDPTLHCQDCSGSFRLRVP